MIGQNIGKYRVLDRIGRGGMGTVYRAIDETLHREVAIKVLNAELNDPEVAKRFRSEAITVARLSHPGIATIYELFQHDGQWLMVMEFVRGETLERMVERMGALSPQRTAELCMQTLAALAHAHSMGVVHRDLKPANIMITETGAIKVMDFGIARVAGTEHLTSAGFMMGTPAYMAPEQVMGKEIDARADLYAIGVVFYRLTTGKLPFKGETPFAMAQSQVNDPPTPMGLFRSDLPPWVEQIVVRALAKSPEERFQSAVEFHEGFARSLAGLPIASAYTSSVSGDLLLTPPRPMPSGAFPRPMTASYPIPTPPQPAVQPVVPQPTPDVGATVLSPSTEVEMTRLSGPVSMSPSAPAASPVESTSAATVPVPASASLGTAAMASPPATAPPPPVPAAVVAPRPATANKSGRLGLIAAAAVAIISIGSFLVFRSSPSAPPPPPIEVAAEPTPAPVEEPPAPEPIAPPPSVPAAPPGPVAGATPTRPATTADARGAGAGGARAAAPAASAPPAVAPPVPARVPLDDTLLEVPDVKLLIVNGRRTNDEDVTLRFANGEMALLAKKGGARIAALPYSSTLRATYTRARDPKWDTSIFGPFQNLDVGGVLRTSKHWLVLQASDAYLILRLEDKNWRAVLATVTARTNIEIARPVSNDKP